MFYIIFLQICYPLFSNSTEICFSLEIKLKKNPREQLELNRLNIEKKNRETRMHKNATYVEKENKRRKTNLIE